eukprot:761286-Hanusia_phi.AAC.1
MHRARMKSFYLQQVANEVKLGRVVKSNSMNPKGSGGVLQLEAKAKDVKWPSGWRGKSQHRAVQKRRMQKLKSPGRSFKQFADLVFFSEDDVAQEADSTKLVRLSADCHADTSKATDDRQNDATRAHRPSLTREDFCNLFFSLSKMEQQGLLAESDIQKLSLCIVKKDKSIGDTFKRFEVHGNVSGWCGGGSAAGREDAEALTEAGLGADERLGTGGDVCTRAPKIFVCLSRVSRCTISIAGFRKWKN